MEIREERIGDVALQKQTKNFSLKLSLQLEIAF